MNMGTANMEGNCPKDGRMNRPIFITICNKRVLAISDGLGNAYKVYGDGYDVFDSICKPENIYSPDEYDFERGLSSFDF